MTAWKAKRFWTTATPKALSHGWGIELDGRPVKTPAKAMLMVPTLPMAEAIASEWDAQEGEVRPQTMPFTRTANAAIDKVAPQHAEVADMLADYGDSDLLCYRAVAPEELIARQAAVWDPLLDWARRNLGADLQIRSGVIHAPQTPTEVAKLRARVHALDSFQLAAFHDLVAISGSLIVGFAVLDGHLDANSGWAASRLDEEWQIEQWGRDEEADALAETKRVAFVHAERVLGLLNPSVQTG